MSDVSLLVAQISGIIAYENTAYFVAAILSTIYIVKILAAGVEAPPQKVSKKQEEESVKAKNEFEELLTESSLVEAAKELHVEKEAIPPKEESPAPLPEKLVRTRTGFFDKIKGLFSSTPTLSAEMLDELEFLLIGSDIGVQATQKIISQLKSELTKESSINQSDLISRVREIVKGIFPSRDEEILETLSPERNSPYIVLVVGVNGVGKTTSCAKLASRLADRSLRVLLIAADTFRAAAVKQLSEWAERISVPVVSGPENAKPQSVVFDGMKEAMQGNYDVVIIDTAGRLQNKTSLMQELEGIRNAIRRHYPDAPHETLLVVDGSTGQNAISQAKEFNEAVSLSGVIITKLDGTPKGGSVIAIQNELGIPVRYIGVGESAKDLRPFEVNSFVDAIFNSSSETPNSAVMSAHGETRRRRRAAEIAV